MVGDTIKKVRTKTSKGKVLYKEITYDNKPTFIHQKVVEDGKDMMKVSSNKGREYWVAKSDKVLTMQPKTDDVAIIGTFESGWLVVDIIQNKKVDKEVGESELKRQLKEFDSLCGGY